MAIDGDDDDDDKRAYVMIVVFLDVIFGVEFEKAKCFDLHMHMG